MNGDLRRLRLISLSNTVKTEYRAALLGLGGLPRPPAPRQFPLSYMAQTMPDLADDKAPHPSARL